MKAQKAKNTFQNTKMKGNEAQKVPRIPSLNTRPPEFGGWFRVIAFSA